MDVVNAASYSSTPHGGGAILSRALSSRHPSATDGAVGVVSVYAKARDYHSVVGKRLRRLCRTMAATAPGVRFRAWCDAGPIPEKSWARRCGLGTVGASSLFFTPEAGSWVFLAVMITDNRGHSRSGDGRR